MSARKVLYNTVSGGEREGWYPEFVPDNDFSIYSPRVSGIRRTFKIEELTYEEVQRGYIVHYNKDLGGGTLKIYLDDNLEEFDSFSYNLYFYPTMYDDGTISDTWFFSYDQNNDVFLDNWSKTIRIKQIHTDGTSVDTSCSDNTLQSILNSSELGFDWYQSDWFFFVNRNEFRQFGNLAYWDSGNNWIYHMFFYWIYVYPLNNQRQEFWFYLPIEYETNASLANQNANISSPGVWMFVSKSFLGNEEHVDNNSYTYVQSETFLGTGWLEWFDVVNNDSPVIIENCKAIVYHYGQAKYYAFADREASGFTDTFTEITESDAIIIMGDQSISSEPKLSSMSPSFSIGETLLNPNKIREISHDNFGDIELGYPDFLSDGIWMFIKKRVAEIPEFQENVGWCWFNREYASSFNEQEYGDFFWFADRNSIDNESIERIENNGQESFTNRQCVLFQSKSAASTCSAIANTAGELFISVLSDDRKTNYYKLIN